MALSTRVGLYNTAMVVALENVGSSRGIRIPESLIEQCGLGESVDLKVVNGDLVITTCRNPREGWDAAFERAGSSATDQLLLEGLSPNRFDHEEWEW